jgi:hypothetical protein
VYQGEAPARPYVASGFNNYVWCRDERWVYIAANDGTEAHLYDTIADPDQRTNVAAQHPDGVATMRERVLADAGGPLPVYDPQRTLAREWYRLP